MTITKLNEILNNIGLTPQEMYIECNNHHNINRFILNFYEVYKFVFAKSDKWQVILDRKVTLTEKAMEIINLMLTIKDMLNEEEKNKKN